MALAVVASLVATSVACSSRDDDESTRSTATPDAADTVGTEPATTSDTIPATDERLTAQDGAVSVEVPTSSLTDPTAKLSVRSAPPLADAATLFGDAISSLGNGVEVSLSAGKLNGSATVRFELPADFDSARFVPAVVWEAIDGTWELVETVWAPGDQAVIASTTHFSIGWPIKIDTSRIATGIGDWFKGLVTGRAGAANPTCGDENAARSGGVEVVSDTGDLVKWCFGRENGRDVVKVTNNWRAGVQVTFPATWTVVAYQGAGVSLQAIGDWMDSLARQTTTTLSRLVGQGQTIVLDPGALQPGTKTHLTVETSTVSWLWSIALTAVDMYLLTVGKLAKLSGNTRAEDLVDGVTFIKCYTDHYGQEANLLTPVAVGSMFDTVTKAAKFGLECGKDVIQKAISGRGGILGSIGSRIVGLLAAAIGVVYGLVNSFFAGIRALVDEVGGLFDDTEIGGYGYDVILTRGAAATSSTTAPVEPSIPNETIQLYLNMLLYGPLDEDGILGPASTVALQQFQTDNGLDITGQPDLPTVDLLVSRAGDKTFLVDGCGYQMPARTDSLYLNCSLSSGLVDVAWQGWTAQEASGTGRVFTRSCDAGCVNGEPAYTDVTVEALDPERWRCGDSAPHQIFTTLRLTDASGVLYGEYGSFDYSC